MSRRGKNNVKRAIVNDATSIFGGATESIKTPTNNFNPLFHYLQTMFPNYDNAVLNAVLEQEGNSIERAIEVLLTFAAAEEPKGRPTNEKEGSTPGEIDFFDDLSDTDDTPSNVFTLPVMPPVTSHNSGRDHVSLYEYRKRRKATKSQRARRRQRAQAQAAAALAAQNKVKKVKWVPLQEFIAETKNPFDALAGGDDELVRLLQPSGVELPATDYGAFEQKPAVDEDETQTLLTQDEIEESWRNFEATQEIDEPAQQQLQFNAEAAEEEEPTLESSVESSADDFGSSNTYEWLHYTPPSPQQQLLVLDEETSSDASSSSSEEEDFVVIEEQQPLVRPLELPVAPAPVVVAPVVPSKAVEQQETKKDEPVVVVKLYYSASDIHRLGLTRSAFTFAKLFDYAAAYLQGKCQQVARSALPRAFALTYVDDEGDVIHLCSEEELAEALRLHEDVFWVDGKQPLLRVHIKALDVAANDGHIVVGA